MPLEPTTIPPYVQRMQTELDHLAMKLQDAHNFTLTEIFFGLPERERYLLSDQVHAMRQYSQTLAQRIAIALGWDKEHIAQLERQNRVCYDNGAKSIDSPTVAHY
jgi:hypothetical protein